MEIYQLTKIKMKSTRTDKELKWAGIIMILLSVAVIAFS